MTTRMHRASSVFCLMFLPLSAAAIGFGNVEGTPAMGERLSLAIPVIEPGNLQAECIGIVPVPHGSDATFFPRRTEISIKTDREGRLVAIGLSGPTVMEPVVEFRVQMTCGTSVARDYTLLAMPTRELRYAPAVPEAAYSARPMPAGGESAGMVRSPRPGPSLEQMAGSRFPVQREKRAAFKQQVRALNPDVLQGIGDHTPIPLDVALKFPAEEPEQAPAAPAFQKQAARSQATKPAPAIPSAKNEPATHPVPSPAVAPATRETVPLPASPVVPPTAAEILQDRLQISSGGGGDDKPPQPGSPEARLADQAADTFARQAELTARLEQAEQAYNELKELILRMEDRMLAIEKERLRLVEESQQKSDWAIPQIVLSILGGGIVGAAGMVLAQNRRRRRAADAIFDIGEIRDK